MAEHTTLSAVRRVDRAESAANIEAEIWAIGLNSLEWVRLRKGRQRFIAADKPLHELLCRTLAKVEGSLSINDIDPKVQEAGPESSENIEEALKALLNTAPAKDNGADKEKAP